MDIRENIQGQAGWAAHHSLRHPAHTTSAPLRAACIRASRRPGQVCGKQFRALVHAGTNPILPMLLALCVPFGADVRLRIPKKSTALRVTNSYPALLAHEPTRLARHQQGGLQRLSLLRPRRCLLWHHLYITCC